MKYEVDTAIKLLTDGLVEQTKYEEIDILDAVGRVCADDIVAEFPVPSYPKSAMDGYAVMSSDISDAGKYQPVKLDVIANIYAGDRLDIQALPGTAVKIMTGAAIPDGYDCVVRQEDTDQGRKTVEIYKKINKGDNYCAVGEDIQKGQKVFSKNSIIMPQHIAVLASMGRVKVKVLKKMKVAIISTGSEVVEPGTAHVLNKTYNSTSFYISSLLKMYGVDVICRKHCKDDIDEIEECIKSNSSEADVIITTGGISVGEKDLLPEVLRKLDAEILFRGVNIKPGTPVTGAHYNRSTILCCSGNPFACLVNFDVFFWNMLSKRMGCEKFVPRTRYATLVEGEIINKKYRSYTRAYYENGEVRIGKDGHSSSIMSSIIGTNCFIINDGDEKIEVGDKVLIQFFRPFLRSR